MNSKKLIIGRTNYRYTSMLFGIEQSDRFSHIYILGRTGTGKTTLLENFIYQDIKNGRGLAFLDPHGDSVAKIYSSLSPEEKSRVIYFNIPENKSGIGYNPIKPISLEKQPLAVSGIMEVFKKLWDESWGARLEHILRNCLFTLYEQPMATLADILRLLNDRKFRHAALTKVTNEQVKEFWYHEYEKYSPKFRAMAIAPIQNKVGAFLANPVINQILTSPKENLKLRKIMDEGKVLLVNLAKGKLGDDASHLLGSLLLTSLGLASYTRADIPEEERVDFSIVADEFQNFTNLAVMNMASELRKYRVGLVLANQYLHQIDKDVKEAILGNMGTLICFRLGASDAVSLEKEFYPAFDHYGLINLNNHQICIKLMMSGKPSIPFTADTLPAFGFKKSK